MKQIITYERVGQYIITIPYLIKATLKYYINSTEDNRNVVNNCQINFFKIDPAEEHIKLFKRLYCTCSLMCQYVVHFQRMNLKLCYQTMLLEMQYEVANTYNTIITVNNSETVSKNITLVLFQNRQNIYFTLDTFYFSAYCIYYSL